jgi:putative N6-adenine-specific DNA methylase
MSETGTGTGLEFFATAARGTEAALAAEMAELGLAGLRVAGGGVRFTGAAEDAWRLCLWSRIAQRVQQPVARFPAADAAALYAGAREVDWRLFLSPQHTLGVSAFVGNGALTHSGFVALKVKDAIVDQLRDRCGARPDVSRDDPDLHVFVHLVQDRATLYVDLAGAPLFRRGYRTEAGTAPLKETLAAAFLRLAGWDARTALLDPLCGAGTLVIEAALWAGGIAPGLFRERFGFERWAGFDATAAARMAELRGAARAAAHGQVPRLLGSDRDPAVIEMARANARRAGLRLSFRVAELAALQPDNAPPWIVANPPYDVRLEATDAFLRELGRTVSRLHGRRVALLVGSAALLRAVPLRPTALHPLWNGDLECRCAVYEVP